MSLELARRQVLGIRQEIRVHPLIWHILFWNAVQLRQIIRSFASPAQFGYLAFEKNTPRTLSAPPGNAARDSELHG